MRDLNRLGYLSSVITQNVDGLHQAAGADRVAELHGNLTHVVCMHCGERYERSMVDEWLQLAKTAVSVTEFGLKPSSNIFWKILTDSSPLPCIPEHEIIVVQVTKFLVSIQEKTFTEHFTVRTPKLKRKISSIGSSLFKMRM